MPADPPATPDHASRADEIRELFAFNAWANRRILDRAATLDDDALRRDLGSSFPSVLATLAHLVRADWVWVRRWRGESPAGSPPEWDLSTLAGVEDVWAAVEAERSAILEGLDDAALDREVDYSTTAGTPYTSRMDEMLRHVVNHSTYHRGQIVTLLRQLGATAPVTDLIAYYRERRR